MANVDVTRIAGNISALNALNSLNNINKALAKHQTRLQTGKSINSAADDPAGYTIATKMMARSEGLKTALNNIDDANNMMSVAESGLSKMNDILVQMRNKAEQAASDTLGTTERQAIQTQLSAYAEQIQNIVDETKWNGTKLLDGTVSKQFQTGADSGDVTNWSLAQNHGAGSTGLNISSSVANNQASNSSLSGVTAVAATQTSLGSMPALQTGNYLIKNVDAAASTTVGKVVTGANMGNAAFNLSASNNTGAQIANGLNNIQVRNYDYTAGAGNSTIDYSTDGGSTWTNGAAITGDAAGGAATIALGTSGLTLTISTGATTDIAANQSTTIDYIQAGYAKEQLQTVDGNPVAVTPGGTTSSFFYLNGAAAGNVTDTGRGLTVTSGTWANMNAAVGSTSSFKYTAKSSYSVDVSTASLASTYMLTVQNAMDTVNNSMSSLGSLMARLSFKSDAISTAQVNVEASYSRIMNANMAEEQVNASKYSILQQTATAMLAQANQAPQNLLSLFR